MMSSLGFGTDFELVGVDFVRSESQSDMAKFGSTLHPGPCFHICLIELVKNASFSVSALLCQKCFIFSPY